MNSEYELTISVVVYKTCPDMLRRLFKSFEGSTLKTHVTVVDNSPDDALRAVCRAPRVSYLRPGKNLGYGAGHNVAIRGIMGKSECHLIVNPDVYFGAGVLERLYSFMIENPSVGFVMPKILYPDGSLQYLCRLLPSPTDLFLRRFLPAALIKRRDDIHALKFTGYDRVMDVPYLSGCFMFLRSEVFRRAGLFDERFFMYMEDVDFARRINSFYRNVYYPHAIICHDFKKDSYARLSSCVQHIRSAVLYFNKWGWFMDRARAAANRAALKALTERSSHA